eukprot:118221-Rhodomonas_salina.1
MHPIALRVTRPALNALPGFVDCLISASTTSSAPVPHGPRMHSRTTTCSPALSDSVTWIPSRAASSLPR